MSRFRKPVAIPGTTAEDAFIRGADDTARTQVTPATHGAPAPEQPPAAPAAEVAPPPARAKEKMPWDDAIPGMIVPFQARLPQRLHLKMLWLKANTPGGRSIQDMLLEGAERHVDREIAKLRKGHENVDE
jgi:hypothetical protein